MEDHRVISLKYVLQLEQGITDILKEHPFGELIAKCLIAWGASGEVGNIVTYKESDPTGRIKIIMKANVKWLFDGHESLMKRCWEQNGVPKFMYPDKTFDDFKESIVGNLAESEKLKNTLIDYITHFDFKQQRHPTENDRTMNEERVRKDKALRYAALALLLAAFFGGLYLNALNHRYKTIGGVVVMDTWTKELLVPDSAGHYKTANPYALGRPIAP